MSQLIKRVLLVITEGSETTEFVIVHDNLKYAGIELTLASLNDDKPVVCSCQMKVIPDCSLESVKENIYDAIVLPGGKYGPDNLKKSDLLGQIVKNHFEKLKLIATICGGALVLKNYGIGLGRSITTYPMFVEELSGDYNVLEKKVVIDGNLITSRGPGTTFEFSFEIIKYLLGQEVMAYVKKGCLL